MSDSQFDDLIGRYLDGRATEAEVGRLDQLVREDSRVRRELLLAAAMDAYLREYLGATADGQSAGAEGLAGPEVFQTRGLVLALPKDGDFNHAVQLNSGSVVPLGHKLWTCPWGGVGTRYSDGTIVSMDRDALADFSETAGVRQIELERGILSVIRWPGKPNSGRMRINALLGSVTFDNAQVTLAVVEDQTVVEVAGGTVEFKRAADGKTVKVSSGQYALIGSENELRAVSGALHWRLEPVKKAPL